MTQTVTPAREIHPGDEIIRFGKRARVEIVVPSCGFTRIVTDYDVLGIVLPNDAQVLRYIDDASIWEMVK